MYVLRRRGWAGPKGEIFRSTIRWAAGITEQTRACAAELAGLAPDVIIAATTVVVRALLQETRSIPIIFLSVSDPVGDRFVNSLSKPAGNAATSPNLEQSLGGKWLQLLKELAQPHAGRSLVQSRGGGRSRLLLLDAIRGRCDEEPGKRCGAAGGGRGLG